MMSQQVEMRHSRIAATYKAREVEGALDVYFYRPLGFRLAEFFAQLKVTPAGVSLLAGLCGVIAGHLYFYRNLGINIAGMVLHVCANALDNADGQLARLTHQESRKGRIIDSVADHLVFASVYIHLTLRCAFAGASPAIWLLALGAAISHASHRNRFLFCIALRLSKVELETANMGQASSRALFEFHSATGNARAPSQKAGRDRKHGVPRPNPRLAGKALSRRCRPHAQVVAPVNDQHAHAGFISSPVPRAAGLLLLVRTYPAECVVRLPDRASGKNG
jgi:CDP-alcohol phosphatidyltransferase